jgi:glycerophosphoryl diester phosphodiesterase
VEEAAGTGGGGSSHGPILFAHRGASALAPENTLRAFRLAIELGATGLESDVHLAADGTPVLVHDPVVDTDAGRVVIGQTSVAGLRRHGIPALEDLYEACGTGWPLSLDLNDARAGSAADAVIRCARRHGDAAVAGLYLCHDDVDILAAIKDRAPEVKLVHSAERGAIGRLEVHVRAIGALGIGVLNLHRRDWSADGTPEDAIAVVHAGGLRAFAWDTQSELSVRAMLGAGADAVYGDDPRILVSAGPAWDG